MHYSDFAIQTCASTFPLLHGGLQHPPLVPQGSRPAGSSSSWRSVSLVAAAGAVAQVLYNGKPQHVEANPFEKPE